MITNDNDNDRSNLNITKNVNFVIQITVVYGLFLIFSMILQSLFHMNS